MSRGLGGGLAGSAYWAVERLEGFEVGAANDVNRTDLVRGQLLRLDMPPYGRMAQAKDVRCFRQDHVFTLHRLRVGVTAQSLTRNAHCSTLFWSGKIRNALCKWRAGQQIRQDRVSGTVHTSALWRKVI